MTLGEKLLQARLEAGLSQRALCGEEITRNMLSLIEHGTAKPSMSTLQYLAGRLGKPVSYFLDEANAVSPNQDCMEAAWRAFEAGDPASAQEALCEYREPDAIYDRQYHLLVHLNTLALAQHALEHGQTVYARTLLHRRMPDIPWFPELEARRARLLARLGEQIPPEQLPNVDGDLMLLAKQFLLKQRPADAARCLDAVQNQDSPPWKLLRGQSALALQEYAAAVPLLLSAEADYPAQCIPALEEAFRELGDYRLAYEYACKGRMQASGSRHQASDG